jgi:hypothetical protein
MKKNVTKVALVVSLVFMAVVVFASDGVHTNAQAESSPDDTSTCPSGGCTYYSWTHYGCQVQGVTSCSPYNSDTNVISGSCVSLGGGTYSCE